MRCDRVVMAAPRFAFSVHVNTATSRHLPRPLPMPPVPMPRVPAPGVACLRYPVIWPYNSTFEEFQEVAVRRNDVL